MTRFRIPFFIPWFFPRRIWKINSNTSVFLTFDDGPIPELTPWVLDTLKIYQAKAMVDEILYKRRKIWMHKPQATPERKGTKCTGSKKDRL